MSFLQILVFSAFLLTVAAAASESQETLRPQGKIVLSVFADDEIGHRKLVQRYDLPGLRTLDPVEFKTSTIWFDEEVEFTGVPLKGLLELSGVEAQKINAIALNDYHVEIPIVEISDDVPIVAYLMNGQEMSSRSKGPLWLVYPYDRGPEYRTEVVYSRSVWQLCRIVLGD